MWLCAPGREKERERDRGVEGMKREEEETRVEKLFTACGPFQKPSFVDTKAPGRIEPISFLRGVKCNFLLSPFFVFRMCHREKDATAALAHLF